jgi:FkbM family methyltransferase
MYWREPVASRLHCPGVAQLTDTAGGALKTVVRRFDRPRAYTARTGLIRGMKQVGGVGLLLHGRRKTTVEEAFLMGLQLEGATAFDVGAFQGVFTMFFVARTGPDGRVVAFEPHPENCRRIRTNLELNGLGPVTVRNVAVGQAAGSLELACPPGGNGGTSTGVDEIKRDYRLSGADLEMITAPMVSIDDETESGGLPDPDFVKVDVEGMEEQVLRGMSATIKRRKPRLFIEIHGVSDDAKRANAARVVELLIGGGYSLHHVESDSPVDLATSERALEGHLYCE